MESGTACFGPVGDGHHLGSRFLAAVCRRRGRRISKDPDAVNLLALNDDIGIRDLHFVAASELLVEVVESSAVKDDGAVALGAHGRGCELADKEGALNAHLLPLLRL